MIMGRSESRPNLTPEARTSRLINMAYDLVEERIRDKTATSQELTHFLKLATEKSHLERELLSAQVALANAKAESIHRAEEKGELYIEAINAMRSYSGDGEYYETQL